MTVLVIQGFKCACVTLLNALQQVFLIVWYD